MHMQHLLTEQAVRRALDLGYHSLQLTHTEEHGIYKYEVVDLRQHQPSIRPQRPTKELKAARVKNRNGVHQGVLPPARACPCERGRQAFFGGWQADQPCRCDSRRTSGLLTCRDLDVPVPAH